MSVEVRLAAYTPVPDGAELSKMTPEQWGALAFIELLRALKHPAIAAGDRKTRYRADDLIDVLELGMAVEGEGTAAQRVMLRHEGYAFEASDEEWMVGKDTFEEYAAKYSPRGASKRLRITEEVFGWADGEHKYCPSVVMQLSSVELAKRKLAAAAPAPAVDPTAEVPT